MCPALSTVINVRFLAFLTWPAIRPLTCQSLSSAFLNSSPCVHSKALDHNRFDR